MKRFFTFNYLTALVLLLSPIGATAQVAATKLLQKQSLTQAQFIDYLQITDDRLCSGLVPINPGVQHLIDKSYALEQAKKQSALDVPTGLVASGNFSGQHFVNSFSIPKGANLLLTDDLYIFSEGDVHIDGNIIGTPVMGNANGQNLVIKAKGTIFVNGQIQLSNGGDGASSDNVLAFVQPFARSSKWASPSFVAHNEMAQSLPINGGDGGSLIFSAPRIIMRNVLDLGHGGNGYHGGNGGNGGNIAFFTALSKAQKGFNNLRGGHGGNGDTGFSLIIDGANGGEGGDAMVLACTPGGNGLDGFPPSGDGGDGGVGGDNTAGIGCSGGLGGAGASGGLAIANNVTGDVGGKGGNGGTGGQGIGAVGTSGAPGIDGGAGAGGSGGAGGHGGQGATNAGSGAGTKGGTGGIGGIGGAGGAGIGGDGGNSTGCNPGASGNSGTGGSGGTGGTGGTGGDVATTSPSAKGDGGNGGIGGAGGIGIGGDGGAASGCTAQLGGSGGDGVGGNAGLGGNAGFPGFFIAGAVSGTPGTPGGAGSPGTFTNGSTGANGPTCAVNQFCNASCACEAVLAVEFMAFTAEKKDNIVALNWSTASELNNKDFYIERSVNGNAYKTIGSVKGNGTSATPQYYAFNDEKPAAVTAYYRLRSMDEEGKETFSKTVSIASSIQKGQMKIYPNPVGAEGYLNIETNKDIQNVIITNMLGQVVLISNLSKINIAQLPIGMFNVTVKTADEIMTERFIRQ